MAQTAVLVLTSQISVKPVPSVVMAHPDQIAQRKLLTRVIKAPTVTGARIRDRKTGKRQTPARIGGDFTDKR
jgi:hypothetical protein